MTRRRRRAWLAVPCLIVVVAGVLLGIKLSTPSVPPLTPAQRAAIAARAAARRLLALEKKDANRAKGLVDVALPTSAKDPAPATPAALFSTPLKPHEVLSFVPYYLMGQLDSEDFSDSSAVVYSSLCVGTAGSITLSGADCTNGWADLHSLAFNGFVEDAHAAGDQVLVSVSAFEDSTITPLLVNPEHAATRLAAALAPIVADDDLDGVNIDIEGTNPENARRFVTFVATLTSALRASDPTGEVVLDAYSASASNNHNFFQIAKLAPLVDRIFIEAYQMENPNKTSANSPLESLNLGYSAVQSLIEYEKLAPAGKLILGLPFYGLDFTTIGPSPGATATTPNPESFNYSAIVAADHPANWDPASETPYASFRRDGSWHQLWYDDPVSIALKVALAENFKVAGVGAWALGMENGDVSMLEALTGYSQPLKYPVR